MIEQEKFWTSNFADIYRNKILTFDDNLQLNAWRGMLIGTMDDKSNAIL